MKVRTLSWCINLYVYVIGNSCKVLFCSFWSKKHFYHLLQPEIQIGICACPSINIELKNVQSYVYMQTEVFKIDFLSQNFANSIFNKWNICLRNIWIHYISIIIFGIFNLLCRAWIYYMCHQSLCRMYLLHFYYAIAIMVIFNL